eukprot:gene4244-8440_t
MNNINIRRAEVEDNRDFTTLVHSLGGQTLFRAWFGQCNFVNLVEYSFFSLIAHLNDRGDADGCAGVMSLNDSINNNDLQGFEPYLEVLKSKLNCKTTNTLFINMWALDHKIPQCNNIGLEMLSLAFTSFPELEYIIWCCPANARMPDFVVKHFIELEIEKEEGQEDIFKGLKSFYVHRQKFLSQLLVRDARVEDNDDLLPIFRNNRIFYAEESEDDYFLAGLIESQDIHNRFFVSVDDTQRPNGMLATSLDVNVDLVTKVFDLESFPDVIIQSGDKQELKTIIAIVIGYPNLLEAADIHDIANENNSALIDMQEIISRNTSTNNKDRDNRDDLSVHELIALLREEISSITTHAIESQLSIQNILIKNFPTTEADTRALLESGIVIDAVIEVVPGTEDADIDDEDLPEALFDAIESAAAALPMRCIWRKVLVDESQDIEISEVLSHQLHDVFESIARVTYDNSENDEGNNNNVNAFVVSYFCIDDKFSSRSEDLLKVAFEEHGTLDYCLMMVPNKSPPTPLTRWMVPVKLRAGVSFDQTLYILHRDALLSSENMSVIRLLHDHLSQVEEFLSPMGDDGSDVLKAFKHTLPEADVDAKDNPSEIAFAAILGDEIIGIFVLSRQLTSHDDITWLRANYQLDELVNMDRHRGRSQAMITHWVLNPVFSRWSRFIMREMMRLYYKTLLFFQSSKSCLPPADVTFEMIPVRPRRRMEPVLKELNNLLHRPTPYADGRMSPLFFVNKRLLSEHKTVIGTRVVVVGGGSATFSLLETFCFVPYLHMTNIYLVLEKTPDPWDSSVTLNTSRGSSSGGDRDRDRDRDRGGDQGSFLTGALSPVVQDEQFMQELYALGLANRVTLIRGRLRDIDRDNKAIVLLDEIVIEYDVLILSTGIQDSFSRMHPRQCAEYGFFSLGCAETEMAAMKCLRRKYRPETGVDTDDIVVYGCGVNAMAVVGRLLEEGIEPRRIYWIVPSEITATLGHDMIDEVTTLALLNTKVTILHDHEIVTVSKSPAGYVSSVTVRPCSVTNHNNNNEDRNNNLQDFPCGTLLTCNRMMCNVDIFTAINECGLVYDGGVVVDKDFRTVDPFIYAVGSFTRFSRVHRNALPHSSFNPREVASLVAVGILNRHIDPTVSSESKDGGEDINNGNSNGNSSGKLPLFTQAYTVTALLPGGLYYSSSVLPGVHKDTTPYLTGDPTTESVCVVQIDPLGIIVEITCVSTSPIQARNLGCAVGIHESYLNGAVFSYESGITTDWIEFFSRDWMTAVCHDKFSGFIDTLHEHLQHDQGTQFFVASVGEVSETTEEDAVIGGERRRLIGDRGTYIPDATRKDIETHTLEFVRKNKSLLTRFHVPVPKGNNDKANEKSKKK